jgi:hypothetical protein
LQQSGNTPSSFGHLRRSSKYASGASRKKTKTGLHPYSIAITFIPNSPRGYTVHIRPAGQAHVAERKAYFTEGDLRDTLERCPLGELSERIIAQAQMTGTCDLRTKKLYLDIARAAALGWYEA